MNSGVENIPETKNHTERDRIREKSWQPCFGLFFFLLRLLNDADPSFIPEQSEQAFLSGVETLQLKSLNGASVPVLFPVLLIENP